jgi:hypothetical protein
MLVRSFAKKLVLWEWETFAFMKMAPKIQIQTQNKPSGGRKDV